MPQILKEEFERYKSRILRVNTHEAKRSIFEEFLRKVFNEITFDEIIQGTEVYLKYRTFKGRADLVYGGVVLEVKRDLQRELEDAEEELKRYLKILRETEGDYIGVATDGILFKAYKLREDNELKEISVFKVGDNAEDFVLWLDSYFFTKRNVKPTANDLQIRFGLSSPTYSTFFDELKSLIMKVREKMHVKLKFELWRKHLEIVYGEAPDLEEFINHTYLITLVKLIMFLRLYSGREVKDIEKVLNGDYFKEFGIMNFIEEDFFTWVLDNEIKDHFLELSKRLIKELSIYNFDEAKEDLFKEIYQDIVGPSTRHRIGEYYTPEWLAKLTLLESQKVSGKKFPKILDPACGSGTFLTNAIHLFKEKLRGGKKSTIINLITFSIIGVDINPIAVIIARANYLLALGELLHEREGEIFLPVYLADSIKLHEETSGLDGNKYTMWIDKKIVFTFPSKVIKHENRKLLNKILDKMKDYSIMFKIGNITWEDAEHNFVRFLNEIEEIDKREAGMLLETFKSLLKLIKQGRDSVWIFIFRNIYITSRLKNEKFDIVIGNPPWIALRYIENKEYQDFLKSLTFDYNLLLKDEIKLFTHMEIATLFFRRCCDLYLKEGGIIAFVMPRSVLTGAKHHFNFRKFEKPEVKLINIFDFHRDTSFKVEPLFNVPACVLIAKKGERTEFPVRAIAFSARLENKNAELEYFKGIAEEREYEYEPPEESEKSYYYEFFRQGASIVPRPLWFVDFVIDEVLGINRERPLLKSSEEALKDAKGRWKEAKLRGNVEKDFIFATLLSKDMRPFGYSKLRPLVLPLKVINKKFYLLDVDELKRQGYFGIAEWLEKAQKSWENNAGERDRYNFPRVIQSINHLNKLTSQNPAKRYVVLYPTSGKYVISCVIDKSEIDLGFHRIKAKSFIIDTKTYGFETDNKKEAYYLSAILNSNVIDELIKPIQTAGLMGERDIHRRPLEFPIPKFNEKDERHLKLAELGEECHKIVKNLDVKGRKKVKEAIREKIREIDRIVSELF